MGEDETIYDNKDDGARGLSPGNGQNAAFSPACVRARDGSHDENQRKPQRFRRALPVSIVGAGSAGESFGAEDKKFGQSKWAGQHHPWKPFGRGLRTTSRHAFPGEN